MPVLVSLVVGQQLGEVISINWNGDANVTAVAVTQGGHDDLQAHARVDLIELTELSLLDDLDLFFNRKHAFADTDSRVVDQQLMQAIDGWQPTNLTDESVVVVHPVVVVGQDS